jgi:hypothetical protein
MWRDAYRTLGDFARRFLVVAGFIVGIGLTWGSVVYGWQSAVYWLTPHGCISKVSLARRRVWEVSDAATMYMIENSGCAPTLDALVTGGYLDRHDVRDPWGSELRLLCTYAHDRGDEVVSAGPDKEFDTADDIHGWDR